MRHRHAVHALLLVMALTGVGPHDAAAAPAPDWEWPDWDALAARHPGAAAVMLLDETVSELGYFGDDGVGRKVETRRVVAILDPVRAAEWLGGRVPDSRARSLLGLEGRVWTSPKASRRLERGDLGDAPLSEGATARPGARWRSYQFPRVAPRSVVELSVTHVRPSLYSLDEHIFGGSIPTQRSRARLRVPRHLASRALAQSVRSSGPVGQPETRVVPRPDGDLREFAWEVRDLEVVADGPFLPSPSEVAPAIWLAPPSPEIPLAGWEAIGRFYFDHVLMPRATATPELRALAERLAGGRGGAVERLRALHAFVCDEIRTVETALDLTGFVPESPAAVLEAHRGGSLDKALLLMVLLKESRIDACVALLRRRSAGPVDTSFHNLGQFDRAGVWVPLAEGGWWLDPAARCPPDYLPAEDQGGLALVIGPGTARIAPTPVLPPEASTIERRLTGTLDPAGNLSGTIEVRATGEHRIALERELWGNAASPQQVAARLLSGWIGAAHLEGFRVAEPRDPGGPSLVTLEFSWGSAARVQGDTLTLLGDFALPPPWGDALGAAGRTYPVVFPGLEQRRDRLRVQPPAGFAVEPPPEVALHGGWFSLVVATERDSTRLEVDRMVELSQASIRPADLDAARDEFLRIADAYAMPARFVRVH